MFKSILTITLLFISASICAQQKIKHFQYEPNYNKNEISGKIDEAFKSAKWGKEFYWFRIGNANIHVWEKDLDSTMTVGRSFTFTGIKVLKGYLDKTRIEEKKQIPVVAE